MIKRILPLILLLAVASCNNNKPAEEPQVVTEAPDPADFERPVPSQRHYTSQAVEDVITRMREKLPNDTLVHLFVNCFPNNLDKAVVYEVGADSLDDPFILTGDIEAMWLRDSGAQVWPYVALLGNDEPLQHLIRGVINRQLKCLIIDPYANAFNRTPTHGEWQSDSTRMTDDLHERKWELDSPCYVLRLVNGYWQKTGDDALIRSDLFLTALDSVLNVFVEQQKMNGQFTSYKFLRRTIAMHDTMANYGWGAPVKGCGLISSAFRPSDDCTLLQFLVPSNFMAVDVLRKTSKMLQAVMPEKSDLISRCDLIANQVEAGLRKHAIVHTEKYGDVFAFEVDGYGSRIMGDDANVPSLLALPYLTDVVALDDPIYQNTRRMLLSEDNPYYFAGTAGHGIGSQHTGLNYIWPMSIIMRAMTSTDQAEIDECVKMLATTHGDKWFMHESFHKDDPTDFTRSWFAWANTLFGELLIKLYDK